METAIFKASNMKQCLLDMRDGKIEYDSDTYVININMLHDCVSKEEFQEFCKIYLSNTKITRNHNKDGLVPRTKERRA